MKKEQVYEATSTLRKAYRSGRLTEIQIARLESIGFDFVGKRARDIEFAHKLVCYLRENPKKYTYADLAHVFGITEQKCYSIIHARGVDSLIKPRRVKINTDGLLEDYDAGDDIAALAMKYDVSPDYVRRIIRSSSRDLPKFLSQQERNDIIKLRQQGKSISEIARIVGRCSKLVQKVLSENNMPGDKITCTKKDIERAGNLILKGEKTYSEIAGELGMSASNVSRIAKVIGASRRDSHGQKATLCVETGKVFSSALAAQRSVNPNAANGNRVGAACHTGRAYKGYHWKYIDGTE